MHQLTAFSIGPSTQENKVATQSSCPITKRTNKPKHRVSGSSLFQVACKNDRYRENAAGKVVRNPAQGIKHRWRKYPQPARPRIVIDTYTGTENWPALKQRLCLSCRPWTALCSSHRAQFAIATSQLAHHQQTVFRSRRP